MHCLSNDEWETVLDVAYKTIQLDLSLEADRQQLIRFAKMLIHCHHGTINEMSFIDGIATPTRISYLSSGITGEEDFLNGNYFEDYPRGLYLKEGVFVYRDSDPIAGKSFRASRMYREIFKPQGIEYFLSTLIHANGQPYGELTLYRLKDQHPFSEKDCAIFTHLTPFIDFAASKHGVDGDSHVTQPDASISLSKLGLTSRQTEIAELVLRGKSNAQIAKDLSITESTVKKHLNSIYAKANVKNRIMLYRLLKRP